MYSSAEITDIYERRVNMVYRICFMYTKNVHNAEDLTQNVFIRLMKNGKKFDNTEYEKAWLIKTASNLCKDFFKSAWYKVQSLTEDIPVGTEPAPYIDETLETVLNLPQKYKLPIYLYYYEGYKTPEIAKMLAKPESTVRSYLARGRKLLKTEIEKGEHTENEYEYKAIL